jgi:hypothetical protein
LGPIVFGGSTNGGESSGGGPLVAGGATGSLCESPKYLPVSQLVLCSNGVVHRPQATKCALLLDVGAAGTASAAPDGGAGGEVELPTGCAEDSDCAGYPLGYCDDGPPFEAHCASGCLQDSDCGDGVCVCTGLATGGRCELSNCRVDSDCGADSLCATVPDFCYGGGFECLHPNLDECVANTDCGGSSCSFNGTNRYCGGVACGRPFLINAAPRLAPIEARADWRDATTPDLTGLTALQRATLAAHWSRLGQMEHASIAAFARFNLQLLSLGAPGELIEACNQALVDETAHTRLCFALASQYGGTRVGPGKLEVRDCFEDMSLTAILKLVIREGCIGETVAALEAVEAAARATDPAVKAALLRIARDEQSHAELAFKFLNWGLAQSSPRARRELADRAEQQLEEFEYAAFETANAPNDPELAAHGMLDASALRAVHLSAAGDVVRPLLSASFQNQCAAVVCK